MAERVTIREAQFLSGGLLLGVNIGWFAAKKYIQTKYDKLAEDLREKYAEETREARLSYERARQNWEKPELKEVVENLGYTPAEQKAINEIEDEAPLESIDDRFTVAEEETRNVFETATVEGWDYESEIERRSHLDPEVPFIIHRDEFFQNDDENYDQTTITYYAGDDVLCDERDEVLEPRDHIVGAANLAMFGTGHGSGDPNVLYIRNPRTFSDFEVVLNDGKYSEDALGFIQHSMFERNRRRQRFDDE